MLDFKDLVDDMLDMPDDGMDDPYYGLMMAIPMEEDDPAMEEPEPFVEEEEGEEEEENALWNDGECDEIDIDDSDIVAKVGVNVMDTDFPVHVYLKVNNLFNPKPTKEQLRSIMDKYHNGTEEERDKAKMDMLAILDPYVFSLLKRNYPTYTYHMRDMVEHGYEGIIKGMAKYDPERGMPTTYFRRLITHEFQEYIDHNVSHSSPHYTSNLKKVLQCIDHKAKNHIPFTIGDIQRETGVPLKTIKEGMRRRAITHISLDDAQDVLEVPSAAIGQPEVAYEKMEAARQVLDLVYGEEDEDGIRHSILTEDEQKVLTLLFGLDGEGERQFTEVERITGIPRYHVSRIRQIALAKLKDELARQRRDKVYKRIKEKGEKHNSLAGLLLSPEEMAEDQEALAEYFSLSAAAHS